MDSWLIALIALEKANVSFCWTSQVNCQQSTILAVRKLTYVVRHSKEIKFMLLEEGTINLIVFFFVRKQTKKQTKQNKTKNKHTKQRGIEQILTEAQDPFTITLSLRLKSVFYLTVVTIVFFANSHDLLQLAGHSLFCGQL